MNKDRLLALLAHAVKQADEWHDECRGGPIPNDPLIEEARAFIKEGMSPETPHNNQPV
jgi:hypothetical protein